VERKAHFLVVASGGWLAEEAQNERSRSSVCRKDTRRVLRSLQLFPAFFYALSLVHGFRKEIREVIASVRRSRNGGKSVSPTAFRKNIAIYGGVDAIRGASLAHSLRKMQRPWP
jgi:hypothetical protein